MFEGQNVMSKKELEARNEVKWETYTKKIQIEARVFGDLSMNHIIPVCTHYQSRLAKNVQSMYDIFPAETAAQLTSRNKKIIEEIAERTQIIETGSCQRTQGCQQDRERAPPGHRLPRHGSSHDGGDPLSDRQA